MVVTDHVSVVRDLRAEASTRVPPMTGRTGVVLEVHVKILVLLDGKPARESWFSLEELEVVA